VEPHEVSSGVLGLVHRDIHGVKEVARWGGEEFFVALPGVDAAAGLAFADDLRRRRELNVIVVKGG
jgi:PleD family two-component response regulator